MQHWFGTWSLGGMGFGPNPNKHPDAVIAYAFEHGIRTFDTAGIYAKGQSECILAKGLRGVSRASYRLCSKGGLVWDGNQVKHDGSSAAIKQACYESLERLKTDYLDVFFLHWPDEAIPLNVSLAALDELLVEGVIRDWGVCNLSGAQLRKFLPPDRPVYHQVHHNYLTRADDVLDVMGNVVSVAYSPFEQGLLSSRKYLDSSRFSETRRNQARLFHDKVDDPLSFVMDWYQSQPHVEHVIFGARTIAQLDNLINLC